MTGRTPVRRAAAAGHARRTRPVRRASAGLSPLRAGAALAMLVSAAATYGVGSSAAFGYRHLALDGARFTDRAAIEERLDVATGTNLLSLRTDGLESRLRELSTVTGADVEARLPDTLAVHLVERTPVLAWEVAGRRYLVDRDGALFAELPPNPPPDAARLPVMVDRRADVQGLHVGDRLDPVDLDAATRLGSIRPADIGSSAASLTLAVTDENGFVLGAAPGGWTAIFGFYTPSLRTTDLIPGQVDLLARLLAGREATIERVVLASDTDGTFVPWTSPAPAP